MNLECTCDYRSQSCKAYCPLLQPALTAPGVACHHQQHRRPITYVEPLRQVNRSTCCTQDCCCFPDHRSERLLFRQSISERLLANKMDPSLNIPNKFHSARSHCQQNWHVISHPKTDDGFSSGPRSGAGDWSRQSMTFDEEERYSAALRQRFIKEMEDLKVKLNYLKNGIPCDGKRLRRRSESEPSAGGRQYKRSRDQSPLRKRRLPNKPIATDFCRPLFNRRPTFQRETRSVPPSMSRVGVDLPSPALMGREEELDRYSDGESSLSIDRNYVVDEVEDDLSDDDEYSSQSAASRSTDSSTPSLVRQSLGSISLAEATEEDESEVQTVPSTSLSTPYATLFRLSLFSNVPPYVRFSSHDYKGPTLPPDVTKHLKWKLSSITPIVVRRTLVNSGFKLVRKSNDWIGQWGKHMNSFVFKTLKDFQKLNHFPGTFQIGRKDRLWKNLHRLMIKFGKKEFGFLPTTYILPQDAKHLRTAWEKLSGKGQWILKPPAAARGTGIRVVHKWADVPKNKPLIVQKYIAQPYLINGSKFDLRLYVLMTSIHPLRIYLYDDGLVRFASVKYSENMDSLGDRFMHLTNYSINKLSTNYCANEDATSCQGHKWTLKTLWTYLEKEGVNVEALQKRVTDLVIKTLISGESHIQALTRNNLPSRYCSYELFGIDVLLDSNLRPWLLEVNISPSLHSASPLDLAVKGPLVRELFNIAGFQIPVKLTRDQEAAYLDTCGLTGRTHTLCYDKRLFTTGLSREERSKHAVHNLMRREEYMTSILENLTPDDVRHLIQFEDELTQVSRKLPCCVELTTNPPIIWRRRVGWIIAAAFVYRFEKVFPTQHTHSYHQYFESPRYYNMMLDAWESKYHNNRTEGISILEAHCKQKVHLTVPFTGSRTKCSQNQSDLNGSMEPAVRGNGLVEEEDDEIVPGPKVSARRIKTGVLAKPTLRAPQAPRRSRVRVTPDRGINTEPLPTILPPKPSLFQTCKIESAATSSQLPPLNIRTSS